MPTAQGLVDSDMYNFVGSHHCRLTIGGIGQDGEVEVVVDRYEIT